jgi:hypothetical protein
MSRIDIRVGLVLEADKHPDADNLYVEKVRARARCAPPPSSPPSPARSSPSSIDRAVHDTARVKPRARERQATGPRGRRAHTARRAWSAGRRTHTTQGLRRSACAHRLRRSHAYGALSPSAHGRLRWTAAMRTARARSSRASRA